MTDSAEVDARAAWDDLQKDALKEFPGTKILAIRVRDEGQVHTCERPVRTLADRKGMNENPTVVDAALRLGARAMLVSPVRSAGILSSLALAKQAQTEWRELRRRIIRLEQKLGSVNQISEAKAILVRTHQVSDDEAYRIIREQAMSKRTATEDIARAIIRANGVLTHANRPGR